jgi:hypothetical protein
MRGAGVLAIDSPPATIGKHVTIKIKRATARSRMTW